MRLGAIWGNAKVGRAVAVGCVALALAGIVLAKARGRSGVGPWIARNAITGLRSTFDSPLVRGQVALSQGAVATEGSRTVYAEVELVAKSVGGDRAAPPVAIAVVLDVSGSMAGAKLEEAKRAVIELLGRMRPTDRVAVVAYSDEARTLVPLDTVSSTRERATSLVGSLVPLNGTNIPAGLGLGVEALAGAPDGFVRRVVLVSDGLDTSGRGVEWAASRVRASAERGVTCSALGVGADYDESYLSTMANVGRGNYAFLERGEALAGFLSRELREASSTSVENVVVELSAPAGTRVTRVLGHDGIALGQSVTIPVGALYAGEERRIVAELALDGATVGRLGELSARIRYRGVSSRQESAVAPAALLLRAVRTEAEAIATRDMEIFASAESAALAIRQSEAVAAWRRGDAQAATRLAHRNAAAARALAVSAPSAAPALAREADRYAGEASVFGSTPASSAAGRAAGLDSNAHNLAHARGRAP